MPGRPRRGVQETPLEDPEDIEAKRQRTEEEFEDMEHPPDIPMHTTDSDSEYEETRPPVNVSGRGRGRGRGAASGRGRGRGGAGRRRRDDNDGDGSLFDIVKSGKTALSTVVDEWIEAYKLDRDSALLDLIQFFIHSAGCKGRITPHMYASMEHAEIIRKMTEEFDEESGDYPLILSGPQWKKFRTNFCEFIMILIRQCQYSIIYDQYMMDNVISLLTGLTDSQVRAFRHTSTLASMKLMTALVNVALNLSINLDHTQRQYEAERTKNRSKQASERLEMLMTKRQEIEENQEEIRNMLTYIFKGVFVHRYRDTQAEIRAICVTEIGVWMKRYATMFLDDSYLKYVGWTLYDRVGDVRHGCLKCLLPLYDTEELSPKLELFTNRFKDRIVEMTLDKEYDVAVMAVKLVIAILRYSDMVLSDKDCENVYELVYSSHRAVAQAAGEFLNTKLFTRELDDATRNQKSKKGKKRSENTPYMRDLVQFFIESELHEHGAYLVDSLWDINDMLKDWECMTDLLLEEPGRNEEAMDDRQETSLIEIMVCCVKQAATGEYPVGRGPIRKQLSAKELKQVQEDKTRLTEHFIVTLPQLLAKYEVDAEKIANLLTIPQYFQLEIYTTSRQEKNLDALLHHIAEIVEKHTDSEVLENCSKVLEALCNEDYAIAGKCNVQRSSLIDKLAQTFKQCFQDFFQEGEEPDEDDAYSLMASLKRIYAFFNCHDLNHWDLWDRLFSIVRNGQEEHGIPGEIVVKALQCCSLAILWSLEALDEDNPDKQKMKELRKRLHAFMATCRELLGSGSQAKVQEEGYLSICDLLIIFSKQLTSNNEIMRPLVYEPDKTLQTQLSSFLNEKVFIDDDDDETDENMKIEELHRRRNFLASFCKLVVYNVVMIRCAADMFKQYMRFYNDYGDIIKATLGKSREINKVLTAKTLALSLTQLYQDISKEEGNVRRGSDAFLATKELGRRFSLSFGLDPIKNRDAVAAMHREGIIFSLTPLENPDDPNGPPPNLTFLEVLSEFSNKLMKQDKKTVLQYLEKHLAGTVPKGPIEDWAPLTIYRTSLNVMSDVDGSMAPPRPVGRPRGARGKRKAHLDDGTTPARGMPQPFTSTAIKRRRQDSGSEASSDFDLSIRPTASKKRIISKKITPLRSSAQRSSAQSLRSLRNRAQKSYMEEDEDTLCNDSDEDEIDDESSELNSIVDFESPRSEVCIKRGSRTTRQNGARQPLAKMKRAPAFTIEQDSDPSIDDSSEEVNDFQMEF